jgi:hypothetical protein
MGGRLIGGVIRWQEREGGREGGTVREGERAGEREIDEGDWKGR